jgi:HlyD family secretion protein
MISRIIRPALAVVAVALAVWQLDMLLDVIHGGSDAPRVESVAAKRGPFIVGISRGGKLQSADVVSLRAPRSGSTLSWLIEDGAEVKQGEVVAKVDVSEYTFEVERQRLEHQNQTARVEQERRDRTRDYESAGISVDKNVRALDMLGRSQLTERQQGEAQVGFDQWNVRWSETDYVKQSRLSEAGIVPQTTVEQSERTLRSREYGLAKSEKDVTYLGAEHASAKAQSESDIDTATFEADLAQRRIGEAVQSAEERARFSAERLREMQEQLAAGEIRAPKAGVVILGKTWGEGGRRTLKEGDRVWSRMKVADLTNLSSLEVRVRVDETSVHDLKVGQDAVITLKTVANREFAGKLTSIGAVAHEVDRWDDAETVPGQRVFDVTVEILHPDLTVLRPGISADVQFVAKRIRDVLYVPVEAVFDKSGGQVVYVKQGDRFVSRKVKIGERNEKAVVVLEGLKAGEEVALSDPTREEAP